MGIRGLALPTLRAFALASPSSLSFSGLLNTFFHFYYPLLKMENNSERMRMPELKALAKMNGLKRYSRLRKADLIELIRTSLRENEPQPAIDEPIMEQSPGPSEVIEQTQTINTSTDRQRKRNAQKAAKLKKKFNNLRNEIDELKSQKEGIEDKIKKATESTSSRFKGKKIRFMKREATKLNERIQEKTKELKSIEANPMSKTIVKTSQQSKDNRRIKRKIEDINRKIRRAKGKTKRNL